ncbi:MAG: TatD family hydrolase [Planctomycetes bacterium]|nr:TatD family hydrolase [Planctomycetota bacterium]
MLIDTHSHINFDSYHGDRAEMLESARVAGVEKIVCIGMLPEGGREALALAKANPGRVYASVGCHPYDAALLDDAMMADFETLLREPECVLMGEMGVDTVKAEVPQDVQERAFARQVELAIRLDKPVCIHSREAFPIVERVIRGVRPQGWRGFAHCFSDGPEEALKWRDLGFLISFAGQVTFKNAQKLRDAVKALTPQDIVVETDCPFLAPTPHRGKRNEPAYVALTAQCIAEQWGIPVAEVAAHTTANARKMLGI